MTGTMIASAPMDSRRCARRAESSSARVITIRRPRRGDWSRAAGGALLEQLAGLQDVASTAGEVSPWTPDSRHGCREDRPDWPGGCDAPVCPAGDDPGRGRPLLRRLGNDRDHVVDLGHADGPGVRATRGIAGEPV